MAVQTTVTAGWDKYPFKGTRGVVDIAAAESSPSVLHVTYSLWRTTPHQVYDVGFDVFDVPTDHLKTFGRVPRVVRTSPLTRENVTAAVDGFIFGRFLTGYRGQVLTLNY